jgi:hypothetical protein
MIVTLLEYAPLLIAICQLAFVLLFALFFRLVSDLKRDVEAIMSFLVSSDTKLEYIIRRQNSVARLIMKNYQRLHDHDAAAMDYLGKLTKEFEAEKLAMRQKIKDVSESPRQDGP